ncbi:hypothetical protein B0H17DRAFT_1140067 [Mycena rosella]|uniref:Uncharacterized protein n=1 Tax=Mycena rosella TaxID=1033263 RepID=A0AAD7GAJ1_MYCRO|nr:hypothetical protein B0H17DRAFT_1140067 [Mycena rosella]
MGAHQYIPHSNGWVPVPTYVSPLRHNAFSSLYQTTAITARRSGVGGRGKCQGTPSALFSQTLCWYLSLSGRCSAQTCTLCLQATIVSRFGSSWVLPYCTGTVPIVLGCLDSHGSDDRKVPASSIVVKRTRAGTCSRSPQYRALQMSAYPGNTQAVEITAGELLFLHRH